jgi:hypothetical protein
MLTAKLPSSRCALLDRWSVGCLAEPIERQRNTLQSLNRDGVFKEQLSHAYVFGAVFTRFAILADLVAHGIALS